MYAVAGDRTPPSSPTSTVAGARRRPRLGRSAWWAKAGAMPRGPVRQRHPQLQHRAGPAVVRGVRELRVRDAAAGRHQVQLAGPDRCVRRRGCPGARPRRRTASVTVCSPVCGWRGTFMPPAVGRRGPGRSGRGSTRRRSVRRYALRERAPHEHRARAAQRDLTRSQLLVYGPGRAGTGGALGLVRPGLEVAHQPANRSTAGVKCSTSGGDAKYGPMSSRHRPNRSEPRKPTRCASRVSHPTSSR